MSEEEKEFRVYTTRREFIKKKTYCEGIVKAKDEKDARSKISLQRGIPIEDLRAESSVDCFIASAVYENPHAREVEVLREYRDNVLMQSWFGRRFVEVYYCVAGEKTAKLIKHRAGFMIPVIKKGLDSIVRNYENKKD